MGSTTGKSLVLTVTTGKPDGMVNVQARRSGATNASGIAVQIPANVAVTTKDDGTAQAMIIFGEAGTLALRKALDIVA